MSWDWRSRVDAIGRWLADRLSSDSKPPATTFAEGQQALMIKLLVRGNVIGTLIVLGGCGLLIWGHWSAEQERLIIYILAGVIGIYALANLATTFGFLVGGPVGRIDLEASRAGFKAGVSDKEVRPAPVVTTETKTTVAPPKPPVDDERG